MRCYQIGKQQYKKKTKKTKQELKYLLTRWAHDVIAADTAADDHDLSCLVSYVAGLTLCRCSPSHYVDRAFSWQTLCHVVAGKEQV